MEKEDSASQGNTYILIKIVKDKIDCLNEERLNEVII